MEHRGCAAFKFICAKCGKYIHPRLSRMRGDQVPSHSISTHQYIFLHFFVSKFCIQKCLYIGSVYFYRRAKAPGVLSPLPLNQGASTCSDHDHTQVILLLATYVVVCLYTLIFQPISGNDPRCPSNIHHTFTLTLQNPHLLFSPHWSPTYFLSFISQEPLFDLTGAPPASSL